MALRDMRLELLELIDGEEDGVEVIAVDLEVLAEGRRGNWGGASVREFHYRREVDGSFTGWVGSLPDIRYNAGYGTQHVYGTVWFSDGSWAERVEYDGSEWWGDYRRPPIPEVTR